MEIDQLTVTSISLTFWTKTFLHESDDLVPLVTPIIVFLDSVTAPGQEDNFEKTYLREIKAIKGKTKKTLLAHGPTLQTKHTEQNNPLQGRNKTCLDLRNPTMGNSK